MTGNATDPGEGPLAATPHLPPPAGGQPPGYRLACATMWAMRVLLSDGSGLTARQVATQLSAAGHVVDVLSSDPLALTRFTRHVRRRHAVPPYGTQPFAWLDAALAVYRTGDFDVLFPTQEQVAVLARSTSMLRSTGVTTAVPAFDALVRVQDKVSARSTLLDLGLPQPRGAVITTSSELAAWHDLPVFVKTPIGTASTGVRFVASRSEIESLATALDAEGSFAEGGVLAQSPVDGRLAMIQAVFNDGSLIASHANLRVREGVGGGASHKLGIDVPVIREHLEVLGAGLGWHGALSADAILTDRGPLYIDINPRLVEPGNAWRSGVDLVGAVLDVATDSVSSVQATAPAGEATHQLLLAVLGAAEHRGTRRAVLAEINAARRHRDSYEDSVEELTPLHRDLRTAVPVVAATLATLLRPSLWSAFSSGAVANYALTPAGWVEIVGGPPAR